MICSQSYFDAVCDAFYNPTAVYTLNCAIRLLSPPRPINTPSLDALKRVLPASLPLLDPLDDRVIPVGSFLFLRKYLVDVRGKVLFVLSS